jgi:light-regulated signal transduction histidine kinase (bacteriophytochrome)
VKIGGTITRQSFGREGADEIGEITVQDNGIGFDEKYLEKMFVVFQRLHGRERFAGTGVGLAVCRRITDRHSGTITARSRPGEGATFTVRLPVRHARVQTEAAA